MEFAGLPGQLANDREQCWQKEYEENFHSRSEDGDGACCHPAEHKDEKHLMRNGLRRIKGYAGRSPSQPGERGSNAIRTSPSSSALVGIWRSPILIHQGGAGQCHRSHIHKPPSYGWSSNDVSLYIG